MTATMTAQATIPLKMILAGDNVRTEFDERELNELADSIERHGLLQPIVVRPVEGGKFAVIAGERRLRAMTLLVERGTWKPTAAVPISVREGQDEATTLAQTIIENVQRVNLSAFDEARGYLKMATDLGMKQAEIAKEVGKSQGHITKRLALLTLDEFGQAAFLKGNITLDQAYDLSRITDAKKRAKIAKALSTNAHAVWEIESALTAEANAKKQAKLLKFCEDHSLAVVDKHPGPDFKIIAHLTVDTLKDYKPSNAHKILPAAGTPVLTVFARKTKRDIEKQAEEDRVREVEREERIAERVADPLLAWSDAMDDAWMKLEDAQVEREQALVTQVFMQLLGMSRAQLGKTVITTVLESVDLGRLTDNFLANVLGVAVEYPEDVTWDARRAIRAAAAETWIDGNTDRVLVLWLAQQLKPPRHADHVTEDGVLNALLAEAWATIPEPELVMPPVPDGYVVYDDGDGPELITVEDARRIAELQAAQEQPPFEVVGQVTVEVDAA